MSNADVNDLRLRLNGTGVSLDGLGWRVVAYSQDYWGFDFSCEKYERLVTMLETNRRFGRNTVSLPDADPWRDKGIESLGYSEIGVYNYMHLDIATNRPGLCRIYLAPQSWGRWRSATDGPPAYLSNEVYQTIANRLAVLGIKLSSFIDGQPDIGGTTLDGVTFSPSNYKALAEAVVAAKRGVGQTFIEGKQGGTPDAIDLSFLATSGRGFREITWTDGESASLDFSALHLALSPLRCNVHIDEFGVVIAGPDGQMSLSPNALHHIANELVLKSIIKDFLRTKFGLSPWYIDHLFVELFNAGNGFHSYGVGIEAHPWKSVHVKAGYTCNLNDGHECRKTFSLSKTF